MDFKLYEEILFHLISNAVKFTRMYKSILIKVYFKPSADNPTTGIILS